MPRAFEALGDFGRRGVHARVTQSGECLRVSLTREDRDPLTSIVALRSPHSHHGGVWAIPGGALNSDETALEGAGSGLNAAYDQLRRLGYQVG